MVQRIALVFGVVFLLVGILGLLSAGGLDMGAEIDGPGMLLGLFPINLLHNILHLVFGVWGLAGSRSFGGAKTYATVVGIIYIVLAICGFFIPTTFGLVPIGGHDIWLHAVIGIVLAIVGFMAKEGTAVPKAA